MRDRINIIKYVTIVIFLFSLLGFSQIKIEKNYLKYNRQKGLKYASQWWHSINNKGGYNYYLKKGGDCANFVSQVITASDFRGLTAQVPYYLVGTGNTIKGAMQLSSRLIGYPLAEPKKTQGAIRKNAISDLVAGDIVYCKVFGQWQHIMVVNNVSNEGVTGHTPHEFYPYPRMRKWKVQLDPNGSVLQTYLKQLTIGSNTFFVPDFNNPPNYNKSTWIQPTLPIAYPDPKYVKTYIHIPDVSVITKADVYEADSKGVMVQVHYRAQLNEKANNGDGSIEPSKADIRDIKLKKDLKLVLRLQFRLPININYQNTSTKEKHSVKLIKFQAVKIGIPHAGTVEVQQSKAELGLTNPKLSKDGKTLTYELPVDKLMKSKESGKWHIEIRAFSKSDGTPLNGNGTYAKYEDKPDLNHWFVIAVTPQKQVVSSELWQLHLPFTA